MEKKYTYHATAQWHLHEQGFVESEYSVPRTISFSAPLEFGGEPGFWTPEHFLLAGVSSCFVATFRAVAEASKMEFQGIEVRIEGQVEKREGGLQFTRITLHPVLIIFRDKDRELAGRLLEKAERHCLVGRSLACTIELQPKILTEKPVLV